MKLQPTFNRSSFLKQCLHNLLCSFWLPKNKAKLEHYFVSAKPFWMAVGLNCLHCGKHLILEEISCSIQVHTYIHQIARISKAVSAGHNKILKQMENVNVIMPFSHLSCKKQTRLSIIIFVESCKLVSFQLLVKQGNFSYIVFNSENSYPFDPQIFQPRKHKYNNKKTKWLKLSPGYSIWFLCLELVIWNTA